MGSNDAPAPDSDHQAMTAAAVAVLSPEEREYLEPERELLVTTYCLFPDHNWACYGEWGGWTGYPDDPRLPDLRREWNLSQYIGHNPVTGAGHRFGHSVPDSYEACPHYFALAVEAFRAGRHADAVRLLGIMAHHAEDSVTFGHMQAIHRRSEFDFGRIGVEGYEPRVLAADPGRGRLRVRERLEQAVAFTEQHALGIREALRDSDTARVEALFVECDNEGARMVADYLRTAIALAGPTRPHGTAPANTNLVANPSFEEDDGTGVPAGWVVAWHDLRDRLGRWEWDGAYPRESRIAHSGRRSGKLMWTSGTGMEWRQRWPDAVRVQPGQTYRVSGWIKTREATGESYLTLRLHRRNNASVAEHRSPRMAGTADWRQVSFEVTIPEGAEKARVACRSDANHGAVWFDDVGLVRLDAGSTAGSAGVAVDPLPAGDDLLLHLRVDGERGAVVDVSRYNRFHGPIACLSAGTPSDLLCREGRHGACLRFDGVDDFVELPRWRPEDVLHPATGMTLVLWMWFEKPAAACLVAKECAEGRRYAGYRVALDGQGKLVFAVGLDGQAETARAGRSVPLRRWTMVTATVDGDGRRRLTVDHEVVAEERTAGRPQLTPCDRDLYLGANGGVSEFFHGRLNEVRLYSRALSLDEIERLSEE